MTLRLQRCCLLMLALCALPAWLSAQPGPAPAAQPSAPAAQLPQDQLDALLAPIALYPDELLSQILIASTYPLDVVDAARFVQQNPGLKGDALNKAIENKPWDPSVLSLTAFPQVLAMMNDKLDWTQQLGDAFLANEAPVMQTVQSLRARAQSAGNLQSTQQQRVFVQDQAIIIEPAQPQYVYVPVYNPTVVYGPWWAPAYRPWYWYPPPIYGYPPLGSAFAAGIVWGSAWAITANHWGWANPNWRGGNININVNNNYFMNRPQYNNRYQNGNWQHNADQRRGVAYRDTAAQNKYRPSNPGAQTREAYRGRDVSSRPTTGQVNAGMQRPTAQPGGGVGQRPTTMERPGSMGSGSAGAGGAMPRPGSVSSGTPIDRSGGGMTRATPTYNASQSRPQAQQYSNRGAQSRASMNTSAPQGGGGGAARGGGGGGGGGGGRGGGGGGGRR